MEHLPASGVQLDLKTSIERVLDKLIGTDYALGINECQQKMK